MMTATPTKQRRPIATPPPAIVVHADWGTDPRKRWLARADLVTGNSERPYVAHKPELVGDAGTLLARLRRDAGDDACIVVGFDFPIGVPAAYAAAVGIDDFEAALPRFGSGDWADFYRVAATAAEIASRRPFYPNRPGGTSQAHLLAAHGVDRIDELRRVCERASPGRQAACPLFWTLGGNQVGKAAIAGWRDLLAPALRDPSLDLAVWPFAGPLADLIRPGRIVLAETYPGEVYGHLGIDLKLGAREGHHGKRWQPSRAANAGAMSAWAARAKVVLDPPLAEQIETGFGPSGAGEDPFDAVVGLLGMLNVLLGFRPSGEPEDEAIRRIEGWILGKQAAADPS